MLKFIRAENTRLKGDKLMSTAADLFSPTDPLMRRAHRNAYKTNQPDKERDIRASVAEVQALTREINDVYTGVRVIDLKRVVSNGRGWSSGVYNPGVMKGKREGVVKGLMGRVGEGRERVMELAGKYGGAEHVKRADGEGEGVKEGGGELGCSG